MAVLTKCTDGVLLGCLLLTSTTSAQGQTVYIWGSGRYNLISRNHFAKSSVSMCRFFIKSSVDFFKVVVVLKHCFYTVLLFRCRNCDVTVGCRFSQKRLCPVSLVTPSDSCISRAQLPPTARQNPRMTGKR